MMRTKTGMHEGMTEHTGGPPNSPGEVREGLSKDMPLPSHNTPLCMI